MTNTSIVELPRRPYATACDARVGDRHTWSRTFHTDDVDRTGSATHDLNPVHFDPEYAAKTRFKRPILHGVATLGEISRALGMDFPGRGTIFLELTARFKRPIYPGDTVHFVAEIIEIEEKWEKLTLRITACVGERTVLEARSSVILEHDTEDVL